MRRIDSESFARDWIAAWNRDDAEWVLAHFAADVIFISPLAEKITGAAEVRGKAALRAYWTNALRARGRPLRFQLESRVWDEQNRALLIVFLSTEPEGRAVRKGELLHFGADGLIHRGEAFSGAALAREGAEAERK